MDYPVPVPVRHDGSAESHHLPAHCRKLAPFVRSNSALSFPTRLDSAELQQELADLLGRRVDLVSRRASEQSPDQIPVAFDLLDCDSAAC